IPLFVTDFNGNIEITGSIVAQSINYNQPMLFFNINLIILIIVQVSFLLKERSSELSFFEDRKKIINTGMYLTLFLSFCASIIFVGIMMTYSEFAIVGSNSFEKSFSKSYILVMSIYILFIGLSSYFIYTLQENGTKFSFLFLIEFLFAILDILLALIFLFYVSGLSPVIRISLGTLISTIFKFLVVSLIYKIKIFKWKIREIKFDTFFAKKIFQQSWMLSTFMIVYAINIILQMLLINLISSTKNQYLFSDNGESLIIISRIIIFSIINLLVIIPKSLGRAINLSSEKPKSGDYKLSQRQFYIGQKYNFNGALLFLAFNLCIFFSLNGLVDFIFKTQTWTREIIPIEKQQSIPFNHNIDISYLDVIKKFVWNGFIISAIAQTIINFSINFRVLMFFNFQKSISLFLITIIFFFISYGLFSYFLGVYLQTIFPGMIGFFLSQIIYGFLSLLSVYVYYLIISRRYLNVYLKQIYEDELRPLYQYNNFLHYYIDKRIKIKTCFEKEPIREIP
ncbi:MAG: hypothetical protein KFW07_00385, partial [Mycoplasmataceae bacterium]|nr:hypothetical protein [Mycoplasmataceae bacterium]